MAVAWSQIFILSKPEAIRGSERRRYCQFTGSCVENPVKEFIVEQGSSLEAVAVIQGRNGGSLDRGVQGR